MRVVVLYNEPGEDTSVDERDVLDQRDAVATAVEALGHQAMCLGCTLDLARARRELLKLRPDVVFNLVESLGGTDRLMALATLLLDGLEIPYTGATTDAILATSDKLSAKWRLRAAGLPTPDWHPADKVADRSAIGTPFSRSEKRHWIIKPVWEHASFGMDDDAVVFCDPAALKDHLQERERRYRRPHFAEQFIEGREFNLSLLGGEVLPPAEIDFDSFPADKPRIVGHRAKWDAESWEYRQTPRRFEFPEADSPLLECLAEAARRCWRLFGLSGYARVDFRVDGEGGPWILEVNANPCLSPEAGFAAALTRAGIRFDDCIERILHAAAIPD